MKKTAGRIFKTLLILCIIGGLGYGAWRYTESRKTGETVQAPSYSRVSLHTGTLSQQVTGTGALALPDRVEVKAAMSLKVEEIFFEAGDAVSPGDKLLSYDSGALQESILSLRAEVATLDSEILSLAGKEKGTQSLNAGVVGRVKAVYAAAGDSVESVMREKGALVLLSLDEKMKVEVPAPSGALPGESYTLEAGGAKYTGTVTKIKDGFMTLSFPDTRVLPGDRVQVLSGSVVIGEGMAEISRPYLVTAYQGGLVDSVSVKVNSAVTRNTRLLDLSYIDPSETYRQKVKEREDRLEELKEAEALYADPALYAQQAAIVSEVPVSEGQEVEKDSALMNLLSLSGFEMNVTVDELDISKVQVGQQATLVMDALPDSVYGAEVSRISQLGESSGGITGYQVRLKVSGGGQLKPGMNGTATIVTGEEKDALLLPLAALQTDRQGSYVWLYREGYEGSAEAPGVKTYVETGLSDADFAAVTSGLQIGDEVLVVRSASGGSQNQGMGFGMPGAMRMQQDGGFRQRPNGSPRQEGGTGND